VSASIRSSERGDGPRFRRKRDELQEIPGVGPSIAGDLRSLGIERVADLKGQDPQRLYDRLNEKTGVRQDPCVLYTFRCAVYYASRKRHDPEKLKWWNWKDAQG
jgi:hypothetical protein